MALNAGSIEIKLFADLARLQSDMNKANKVVDASMRNIDKSVALAKKAFGGLASSFGVFKLVELADSYKRFESQLKLSTKTANDYSIAYENVIRIGRTAQSDIGAIGVLYARLNNNLRDFNVTQNQVSSVTETISLALRTNNATVQETNSVMLQLSQSFGSGKLNGQEFLAVAEGAPALLRQLAKAIGVPFGALKDLSAQGKITREELLKAWTDPEYLASLRKQATEVGTISSAITVLTNNLKQFVGEQDKATGASKIITASIIALADNINMLATVAIIGLIGAIGRWIGVKATLAAAIVEEQRVTAAKAAGDVVAARAQVAYTEAQVAAAIASNAGAVSIGNNAKATTLYSITAGNAAIAQTNLNKALAASNPLMVAGRGIIAALGGPIGVLITALGVGAVAFQIFGKSSSSALDALYEKAKRAREELEKAPEALIKATPGLLEQNAKRREILTKREIALQTQLDNLKARGVDKIMPGYVGIFEAQLLKTQIELSDSLTVYHDLQLQRIEAEKTIKDTTDKSAAAEKFLRDQNIKIMSEEVAMQRKIIEMAKAAKDIDSASRNKIIEEATNKIRELTGAKKADKEADKERVRQLKESEDVRKRNEEAIEAHRQAIAEFNKAQEQARVEAIGNNDELKKEVDKRNEAISILLMGEEAYALSQIAKLEDAIATNEQIVAQAQLNGATEESIKYAQDYINMLKEQVELKKTLREKEAIQKTLEEDKNKRVYQGNQDIKEQESLYKSLERTIDGFAKNAAQSMTDWMTGTKVGFSDMINSILKDILRLTIQDKITNPLTKAITGALGKSDGLADIFSGLFQPTLGGVSASAGDYNIDANPYLNFTPKRSFATGTNFVPYDMVAQIHKGEAIIPAHQNNGGGVGGNVSVVINNNSSSQATANETIDSRGNRRIEVTIGEMVAGEIRRNGSGANQAIRNTFNASPTLIGR